APVVAEMSAGFRSAFPGATTEEVLLDAKSEAGLPARLTGATAVLSVGAQAASAVAKAKTSAATIACVPPGQADFKSHGPTLRLQPPADGVIAAIAWLGGGRWRKIGFV